MNNENHSTENSEGEAFETRSEKHKGLTTLQKVGVGAALVCLAAVSTFALVLNKPAEQNVSKEFTQLQKEKNVKVLDRKSSEDFSKVTGENLNSEDINVITTELNQKDKVDTVYWVHDSTDGEPEAFDDNLIASGEYSKKGVKVSSYNHYSDVKANPDALNDWSIDGDKSETKNGVLNMAVKFSEKAEEKSALSQLKAISELTDSMNENHSYTSKHMDVDVKGDTVNYVFEDGHGDVLVKVEQFKK